jgi:hypothetical protein
MYKFDGILSRAASSRRPTTSRPHSHRSSTMCHSPSGKRGNYAEHMRGSSPGAMIDPNEADKKHPVVGIKVIAWFAAKKIKGERGTLGLRL